MAKKGVKVQHVYKLKHMDEWNKLRVQKEPKPEEIKPINPNTNQLWRWDNLEDVKI